MQHHLRALGNITFWTGFLLLVGFIATSTVSAEESEALPLPRWPLNDARNLPLDDALWPPGTLPPLDSASGKATAPSGAISNFFKLFIPNRSRNGGPAANGTADQVLRAETLSPLPLESLQECSQMPADSFLLDAQHLITETQAGDLRHLLITRAEDAGIAAYFLILGPQQTLPANADLTQLASGALNQRPSCLVVYHLGNPQRTRMFASREIAEVTPPGYLSTLNQECVRDALLASEDVAQLERFVTQLSIRLFWLERSYPVSSPSSGGVSKEENPATSSAEPLPEVSKTSQASPMALLEFERWKPLAVALAWPLFAITALWFLIRFLIKIRRRRHSRTIWLLPEVTPAQRLGGTHCGGCGGMLKYG